MFKIEKCLEMQKERYKRMERERKAEKFAVGLSIIGAIGLTTGIVMTVKKGMELHKMCKGKALDTVEKTKTIIQDKADAVHDSAEHTAKAVDDVINNLDRKADDLHKNIKHGYHEVKNDVSKTIENITSDLKKDEQ